MYAIDGKSSTLTADLKGKKNIDHKILQTKTSYKGKAVLVVILLFLLQGKGNKLDLKEEGLTNKLLNIIYPKNEISQTWKTWEE